MEKRRSDLEPLLAPSSVAVVGASPDSTYSSGLVEAYDHGFEGTIYPVNPNRKSVWGAECFDSLSALPERVDLVIICIPRKYVVETLREAGVLGVPAAVILTAGFSESDEFGNELEDDLVRVAEEFDIKVCGPNCNGIANLHKGAVFKARGGLRNVAPGSIGLISQSGALAFTTFFERGVDEDIRFSHVISTGNESVLTTSDYLEFLANDPHVEVICTYIEGIAEPSRFISIADASTRNGTPVLTVKIGKSQSAEAATISHTGSLVGNDDAWEAAFTQSGVQRVSDIPDLLNRARAHVEFDPPDSPNVCIASTSGGLASLLADLAVERGLELPELQLETEEALLNMDELMTFGSLRNPADIRGYGVDVLHDIAETLFADDSFDSYVFAFGMPAVGDRAGELADKLLALGELASSPTLFLWTGRKEPDCRHDDRPFERVRANYPLYYDPSRCMDALKSLINLSQWQKRHSSRPSRAELRNQWSKIQKSEGVHLPRNKVLLWEEAERLLSQYNISVINTQLATDEEMAEIISSEIDAPMVYKVDSRMLPHRSQAGAVLTNVEPGEAKDAYRKVVSSARQNNEDITINGVLIQPQVTGGMEALVGVTRDDIFGPLVTVAPGGVHVEQISDPAVRIPPITIDDGLEAISETMLKQLVEHRNCEASTGLEELAELMISVGQMVTELEVVDSIDLNPVFVTDNGINIADIFIQTN